MLTVEQVHEAVEVLQSMGYHVVKFRPVPDDAPAGSVGAWYRGTKVTIGDEYTLPDRLCSVCGQPDHSAAWKHGPVDAGGDGDHAD